jgi:transcriptional regulator with XRE-family HTH domain
MRLKNEIFLAVLDWLHFNKNVRDQAHLAEIIGIDATSMSRIMNGRNEPSEKTLRKLNEAFGNIFNMDYLRGLVPYPMLADDPSGDIQPTNHEIDLGTSSISIAKRKSEKDIIDVASELIVELEALRRQTNVELVLLKQARQSFESATDQLQKLLKSSRHDYFPNLAAEDTENH